MNLAQDYDFAGADAGGDDAVAANGDAAIGQVDRSFDLAVDVERLRTGYFALHYKRASDGGLIHRNGNCPGGGEIRFGDGFAIFVNLMAAASMRRSLDFRAACTLGATACGE